MDKMPPSEGGAAGSIPAGGMKGANIPPMRNFVLSCRPERCPAIAGPRGGVEKILSDGEELFVTTNKNPGFCRGFV